MAEFIDFEAVVETEAETVTVEEEENDEENQVCDVDSFLDDAEKENDDVDFYRQLENTNKSIDQTLQEEYELSLAEIENFDNFSNFCESSEDELGPVDEFKDSNKRLEKFEETLIPKSENHNTFPDVIFYGVRFNVTEKSNICSDNDFQDEIENVFNKIDWEKFQLELDNQKFNQQCLDLNQVLSEYGYFLRVYELKNKFRELRLKDSNQEKIIRQLSGCIQEKFDAFNIIYVEYNKKLRKKFKPINVIYEPVRKPEKKNCVTVQQIFQKYIEALVAKEKKIKKK